MLAIIKTVNGVKKIIPLTADAGAGNPVGTIIPMYKKSNPSGYLYCDGSTFDETVYPLLYAYLGSNVLPDYREFALVGAEENTTSSNIATHDIYTQGEEKDDQFQYHRHEIPVNTGTSGQYRNITGAANKAVDYAESTLGIVSGYGRHGTVTRGKRKAVYFYIKATSGLPENQQDNVLATINANNSYSTTEHATGKKTTDGKDIYSRTFIYNNKTVTGSTWAEVDSNFPISYDKVVSCNVKIERSNASLAISCLWSIESTSLKVWQSLTGGSFKVTVNTEYTKD